jgi:hypothetical protein
MSTPEREPVPAKPEQPEPESGSNWTAGRVFAVAGGSVMALIGIALLLGGLALVAAHAFARDVDGYYTTGTELLETDSYAIATDEIDLGTDVNAAPDDLLGTVRIQSESTSGRPTFVGIGPSEDVDTYLDGVAYAELTDFADGEPEYTDHPGDAAAGPPAAEDFWVAESEGSGAETLTWDVESGDWSILVMDANAEPGVSVDADIGVKIGWLIWAGVGLVVIGLLFAGGGVALIVVSGRRATRGSATTTTAPEG